MNYSKGAAIPGGSLTVLQNAFKVLQPQAVFSVWTCTSSGLEKVRIRDVVISSKVKTSEGFKTLRGTELLLGNFLEVLFERHQIDGLLHWRIQMNWKLKYIAVVIIILSYLLPEWIWWHLCKISWGICSWDRRHRSFITETNIRCLTLSSWRHDGNTIVIFLSLLSMLRQIEIPAMLWRNITVSPWCKQ